MKKDILESLKIECNILNKLRSFLNKTKIRLIFEGEYLNG